MRPAPILLPAKPPELCGHAPLLAPKVDPRWLRARAQAHVGLRYRDSIAVNADRWVNKTIRYRADATDDWAPPMATLDRGYGDCEDIALLKRAIILRSGVPESRVFFLLVRDLIRQQDHAVLAVDDGGWRLLDSANSLTLRIEEVEDYRPVLAFSGEQAWLYGRRL